MRRPIHLQGGAFDLSQLGIPALQSLSQLAHPALLSNLGTHNVLQGLSSPLHANMLRSTGGDLIDDLYHTGRHLLGVGLRGGDFLDSLFSMGRNLLGVGLYAQPHHSGGVLMDHLHDIGHHLYRHIGMDGHHLNNELRTHGKRMLHRVMHGEGFFDTLGRVGEAVLPHLADAGIHYLMSGGAIPQPPSRSTITAPSQMEGGDLLSFLQGAQKGLHVLGTPFEKTVGVNPADLGQDIAKAIMGRGATKGEGVRRKGRFVKGSPEAKAYMASIRKKK
jgi:hypothetical protein